MALADPLPVSISPTRIEFSAPPGQHLEGSIKFWNGTKGPLPVALAAFDVMPFDESGHFMPGEEDPAHTLAAWVQPRYPQVTVYPKEEITLDFTIDVPADADPGTHWGTLYVTTVPAAGGAGASVQARIGVIILVRVAGNAEEQLTLESFSGPRFSQAAPVALEARFKNGGTVHEAPAGSIEVRDLFGFLAATATLPVRNVLPGTARKIPAEVSGKIWLGRYRAVLHSSYGDGHQALPDAVATFWVVPWRRYGAQALVALSLLALAIWKRRNFGAFFRVLLARKLPEA